MRMTEIIAVFQSIAEYAVEGGVGEEDGCNDERLVVEMIVPGCCDENRDGFVVREVIADGAGAGSDEIAKHPKIRQ